MNKVKQFIKENNLIQNGDHIIIGVSGGADSVYLLLVLNELRKSMDLTITAVQVITRRGYQSGGFWQMQ